MIGLGPCEPESGATNMALVHFTLFTGGVDFSEVSSTVVNVGKNFSARQALALAGGKSDNAKRIGALLLLLLLLMMLLLLRRRSLKLVKVCNERRGASILSQFLF